jgi:hypothetical protein
LIRWEGVLILCILGHVEMEGGMERGRYFRDEVISEARVLYEARNNCTP